MQLSPASHGGLLDSDCRLAATARSLIRVVRSTMYEMKFGLIGFAIGTMAITGGTLASAPKAPVAKVAAVEAPAQDMLWPVLPGKAKHHRD
jgi:hypothetical protein